MQRSIDILVELLMPEVTWHFPRGSKVRVDVASRLQTGCKQVASRCKQVASRCKQHYFQWSISLSTMSQRLAQAYEWTPRELLFLRLLSAARESTQARRNCLWKFCSLQASCKRDASAMQAGCKIAVTVLSVLTPQGNAMIHNI